MHSALVFQLGMSFEDKRLNYGGLIKDVIRTKTSSVT